MAQVSVRAAHRKMGLQVLCGGLLMGIGSLVLFQFIPIVLFLFGMLASPVPFLIGCGFLIRSLFPYEPLPHIGEPCPEPDLVRVECFGCKQNFTTSSKMVGTPFQCPKCKYQQHLKLAEN